MSERRRQGPAAGAGAAGAAYLDMPVRRFLDALAAGTPAPGGGAAAALTVTLAAGLCAMSARLSTRQLPSAAVIAEEAERLRGRAAPLAQADAAGYQAVLDALRGRPGAGTPAAALSAASATPMSVAEIGARVASLAAVLAAGGNPAVRGDAVVSAVLAAAAAQAAAALVCVNLDSSGDDRPGRADLLAAEAAERAQQAQREEPRAGRYL